jgi:hypothetical protein
MLKINKKLLVKQLTGLDTKDIPNYNRCDVKPIGRNSYRINIWLKEYGETIDKNNIGYSYFVRTDNKNNILRVST